MARAIFAKEDPDSHRTVCFDSSLFWRSSARCFFGPVERHRLFGEARQRKSSHHFAQQIFLSLSAAVWSEFNSVSRRCCRLSELPSSVVAVESTTCFSSAAVIIQLWAIHTTVDLETFAKSLSK